MFLLILCNAAEEDWKDTRRMAPASGGAWPRRASRWQWNAAVAPALASDQHRRVTRLRIVLNSPFGWKYLELEVPLPQRAWTELIYTDLTE